MHTQIQNVGLQKEAITKSLIKSGLWTEGDNSRYGYTLSPCVYALSQKQAHTLGCLGQHVYSALESLDLKLNRLGSSTIHLSKQDARFLRLAKTGTKNLLSPRDGKEGVPPVVKVDLVQDVDGNFRVAEVDAYNPRGLGYLCLLEQTLEGKFSRPQGEAILCSLFGSSKRDNSLWVIIVSEYERYYEPAFKVLVRALAKYGIPAKIVREEQLAQMGVDSTLGAFAQTLCIPESLYQYPKVRDRLMERYRDGSLYALFPPKAYLGSKGFLPYFGANVDAGVYVPKTSLVSLRDDPYEHIDESVPSVLKATVSSGMKQVLFSDLDSVAFSDAYKKAKAMEYPTWVLQEQVKQIATPVEVYGESGSVVTRNYYFRVIAHITKYGVLDVEVTGRPDRKVHGAPDCIQLPSILI